ncbi:hypothetical protein CWM66_05220 [Kosakonia sp. H7A]|nr:hypothetical protein [Kosakonia sp. MH5]PTA93973.1 hypothetical protein CWM66_05220 [Kosakonia sp. H7A]
MFAFLSAIYGLLSALLLKTASYRICFQLPVNVTSLLLARSSVERENQGTEQWRVPVHIENTVKKQQISVSAVRICQTCISLITVLITSVNTITLLHNLFSGESKTP